MPPKQATASRKRGSAAGSGASQAKKPANFMEREVSINFNDSKISHDRVVAVGDKKFYVVSGILSLYSGYLKTLFDDQTNKDKEVELKDAKAEDFKTFLCVLCPGKDGLDGTNVCGTLMLADRFEAPVVWQKCWDFILQENNVRGGLPFKILNWMAENKITITAKLEQKVSSPLGKLKYEQFSSGVFESGLETVNKHDLAVIKSSMDKEVLKGSKAKNIHYKHKHRLPPSPQWLGLAVDYDLEQTKEFYLKFYKDVDSFDLDCFFADFLEVISKLSVKARQFIDENISNQGISYDFDFCAGFPDEAARRKAAEDSLNRALNRIR